MPGQERVEQDFFEVFGRLPRFDAPPTRPGLAQLLEAFFPGAFELPVQPVVEVSAPEPVVSPAVVAPVAQKEAAPARTQENRSLALAQLYIEQGYAHEAKEILDRILAQDPGNLEAKQKLQALQLGGVESFTAEQMLERWLGAISKTKKARGLALLA